MHSKRTAAACITGSGLLLAAGAALSVPTISPPNSGGTVVPLGGDDYRIEIDVDSGVPTYTINAADTDKILKVEIDTSSIPSGSVNIEFGTPQGGGIPLRVDRLVRVAGSGKINITRLRTCRRHRACEPEPGR